MILIIAEKPSVMKNIIDAGLEPAKPRAQRGFARGNDFIYTHCIGHLLSLKMPGDIDPKYKSWNIYNLPFFFEQIPLEVSSSVEEQFKIVSGFLAMEEITEVINACDSDREGDLIFRNLYHYTGCKCKKVSRMWIESQTKEGILESFNSRLPEKDYNNVYFAGKSRSYADYIIGLNSTMAMTNKFGSHENVLSVGRVQTPTLRIIVDVEKDIIAFKGKKYYKLQAEGIINEQDIIGNYINKDLDNNRFQNKFQAEEILKKIGLGEATVVVSEHTKRNEKPKMLYSLSDLQVDMDKRYGYTPIDVLNTVQALYETHKLVTYPRTDENHISEALASQTIQILSGLCVNSKIRDNILANHYTINPIMIAKKELGAHEALTPTNSVVAKDQIRRLNEKELKVYMAIVERFMASFYPDAIIEKQKIIFERNQEQFSSEFEIVTDEGHRAAYVYGKKEKENNKKFLSVNKGDIVIIKKINLTEGETTPPTRFTEGSLVKMMKNPTKYVEVKEDKDVLKKVEGIGTEATRAHIIEELKKRKLITVDEKKYIHPTEKGMSLIDIIPNELIKSVKLTAEFERKLDLISNGKFNHLEFLNEIQNLEREFIEDLKAIDPREVYLRQQAICRCPVCNGYILPTEKGYFCQTINCRVGILIDARGAKKITASQAKSLFETGNSGTKVLCKSKSGHDFEALMLYRFEPNERFPNQLDFNFEAEADSEEETSELKEKEKSICKCPICKSPVIDLGNSFSCKNKDCRVSIFKAARGIKKMTKKAAVELLKDGVTSSRVTVTAKDGHDMEVYLTYKYVEDDKYPNHIDILFKKQEDNTKKENPNKE